MVGQRIRSERTARGWTQAYVASEVDANPRTVRRWESGESRPENHHLLRLARLFGIDPEELV